MVTVAFIAGFVAALVVFQWWESFSEKTGLGSANENDAMEMAKKMSEVKTADQTSTSVVVKNQPAGRAVAVERLELTSSSWIAVRETEAGFPTRILGAVLRDKGAHADVLVDLLRGTEPDRTYLISLYVDNGDAVFDSKVDVLGEEGEGAYSFMATTPVSPTGR